MGSDIFGALFASVSGLDSQSTNLSIIANNISNSNTTGYKATQTEFQTLVSGTGSSANFASGGVTADNRQLIDQQGLLQSTNSPTDIAIQGSGFFVVNTVANSSSSSNSTAGEVLYTRAGSFTQNASGNFVNAAGYFLQAWPLDANGLLPGAPGNTTDTVSSANLSSLQTVNVQNVAGKASSTTKVTLSANLNASQKAYPGASATVTMDANNATDTGITAKELIIPDAPSLATGSLNFNANPANNDTVILNGVTWTFVAGVAGPNQTQIQGSLAATMAAFASDLNASGNVSIDVAHYTASPTGVNIAYNTGSVTGNSYTLATGVGAANENISGATLTGAVAGVDSVTQGDQISITTQADPTGFTYTYGGITFSRSASIAGGVGQSDQFLQQPQILALGNGAAAAIHWSAATPTTMTIDVNPLDAGVTQVGQVVKLTGTTTAGLNVNNITNLDGDYYVTSVGANSFTVTIPSNISPPSPVTVGAGASINTTNLSPAVTISNIPDVTNVHVGDTVTFANLATTGGIVFPGSYTAVVTAVTTGVNGSISFNGPSNATSTTSGTAGASSTFFDTDGDLSASTSTVTSRLFTGNVLDATSTSAALVTSPSSYTAAALTFTITTTTGGTQTFTYTSATPNASLGQFNTLDSLAAAINDAAGLSARVVNNQLYVGALNGNDAITFANGSTTGSNTSPPLGGIDWVGELGLKNVAAAGNRFSTLQGLAALVNNSNSVLTATVANPLGTTSVKINVNNPLDKITFSDGSANPPHTNTGSLLSELGLQGSLASGAFAQGVNPPSLGPLGPAYDPTKSVNNMASGAITPQFSRSITVYDSLGAPHNLNTAFINTGTNTWAVEIYAQPSTDVNETNPTLVNGQVATGTLSFNGDGSLQSITPGLSGSIPIDWANGAVPSSIIVNWGTAGALGTGKTDGMSQFSSPYNVNFVNQNGSAVGQLTGVSISTTGLITASFSNGQTQNLYQIPLASFTDPDQLQSLSGNVFAQSSTSGQVNLQQIGSSSVGTITSSSLEESNVQLADQLTSMIVAQQAYQANTKVISTAGALLTALTDAIRA
jgi:flagellar hook protein FlgE